MSGEPAKAAKGDEQLAAIEAQAVLHHQYFLGLQLMVSTREGATVVGDWIFRLFRRQHEQKFLSSFRKLGLSDLPDAVACAKYHVLSNSIGGVTVEYMEESPHKAWVRFRYPRWMFDGPVLCGMPVEASRGFLEGWYAQNGVSLGNPRLAFVCVSEDMTGEFGLCGYFREFDHELADHQRLQFARGERPPPFDPEQQPSPPSAQWNELRLAKAKRNYAVDYVRNGIVCLASVLGPERTRELGGLAARLTGLQSYARLSQLLHTPDGDLQDAADFVAKLLQGMGDTVVRVESTDGLPSTVLLRQLQPRLLRGLEVEEGADLLHCWQELVRGLGRAHRELFDAQCEASDQALEWTLRPL